jgi:hypothetical protein
MFSNIDHIILYLLLHLIFILWGYKARKLDDKSFLITAIIPIVCYSIIEGCRYGRGPDYLVYKEHFENYFSYRGGEEPLFIWLNHSLKDIGFTHIGAFIVYSLIFIICIIFLLKDHKNLSLGTGIFFFTATFQFTEGPIRQAVGFSFIFLAIKFFYDQKWLFLVLSIIAACTIHSSNIIILVFIVGLYFIKKPIPIIISIPLYLFFTYIYDMSNVGFLGDLVRMSNLSLDSKFQSYVENSDHWFSAHGISDIYDQSLLAKTLRSLFDVSILYLGNISLKRKPNQKMVLFYSFFVFGALVYKAFFNLEILRRIADPFYIFWFLIVGYAFYEFKEKNFWIVAARYSVILYVILFLGRFIFFNPNARFVWNYIK